jgi:hypothetical protein
VYWNEKIYVTAGYNGSVVNTLHIYDIANDTWTTGGAVAEIAAAFGHLFNARRTKSNLANHE